MSGHALPGLRPDAHDALNRFSFGSPQVRTLLAGLAAERARQERADCVTEAHVKAAARTLATDPNAADPDVLRATLQDRGQAVTPARKRALPAWLAKPVETYGAIVLAVGVVATVGWVALGYSEAPTASPPVPASQAAPAVAEALPAVVTPAPASLAPASLAPASIAPAPPRILPAPAPEPPATASVEDPLPLPIPPRKPPVAPRNPGFEPTTTPSAHKHYLVWGAPRERGENDGFTVASPSPATPSTFQSLVRRFPETADAASETSRPGLPQQRFIGSYVMGPNGTRQFVPDP